MRFRTSVRPRLSLPLLGAALLLPSLLGCGGSGSLSGTVTYKPKNKKVVSGNVMAMGEGGKGRYATIKPDGSYAFDSLPRGTVKIAVNSPQPKKAAQKGGRESPLAGRPGIKGPEASDFTDEVIKAWFPIPDKYGDVSQSGLTTTIKPGPNTFDIVLD